MSEGNSPSSAYPVPTPILRVQLDHCVNFALQQNAVPVIKRLELENGGAASLRDIRFDITAEPAFARDWSVHLEALAPGTLHAWKDLDLRLSPAFLGGLDERLKGQLHIRVRSGDQLLLEQSEEIDLLAANEWAGLRSLPEMLAAFVQPNHRALAPILSRTARLLRESDARGGGICGYQRGSAAYVWQQAQALYQALQELGIAYSNPPASFEQSGQKIRPPDVILADKLATCLDLTVLVASCLEQMGLHPVIILLQGHCFPGVWLQESDFPYPFVDNPLPIQKRLDLDALLLFESTLIASPEAPSFTRALGEGKRQIAQRERFVGAIDLARARTAQIRPMPARMDADALAAAEAALEAADAAAPGDAAPALADDALGLTDVLSAPETPQTRLDRWRRRLLDLTMRNRMLNFRPSNKSIRLLSHDLSALEDSLAAEQTLKLTHRPDAYSGADPRSAEVQTRREGQEPLQQVLAQQLARHTLHTDETEKRTQHVLTEIYRTARGGLEEGGASCLYLAVGFLAWYESDIAEKPRLAPLLLIPVELLRLYARQGFELKRGEDDTVVNTTLLEKLRTDHNLDIRALRELPLDEAGVDVAKVLRLVKKAVLDIPRWEVLEDVHLGFFSFQKFLMWRDLNDRSADLMENPVVRHLVETPTEVFRQQASFPDIAALDAQYAPTAVFCPRDADSSQLRAVIAAAEGASLVLKGPPGTGKSQTITNLIAHALATGKTVLFVSEKMAALNVVHDRLKAEGLEDFCAELHSNKAQKRRFIDSLYRTYQLAVRPEPADWAETAERLRTARERLNDYVLALHREHANGLTVYGALARLCDLRDAPVVRLGWPRHDQHSREARQALTDAVATLVQEQRDCGDVTAHPWRLARATTWSAGWRDEVAEAVGAAQAATDALAIAWEPCAKLATSLQIAPTPRGLDLLTLATHVLVDAPRPSVPLATTADWGEASALIDRWMDAGLDRDALYTDLRQHLNDSVLQADFSALKAEVLETRTAFILLRWFKRRGFTKRISAHTKRPFTEWHLIDGWLELGARWQARQRELDAAGSAARALLGSHWAPEKPGTWGQLGHLRGWTENLRALAAEAADGDIELTREWRRRLAETVAELQPELASDGTLGKHLLAFRAAHAAYLAALDLLCAQLAIQRRSLEGAPDTLQPWDPLHTQLAAWAGAGERLRDWCFYQRALQAADAEGLGPLTRAAAAGVVTLDTLPAAFERAYLLWWYESVADTVPALRDFRGFEHERQIQQFREIDDRFMQLTREMVVARLLARVPQNPRNPSKDSEAGILVREAQKKTRHLSIRRMIGALETLLPRLKPCMLMSPISVAQYLDASYPPFDLVIFDEASQIPVWDAIGSIARGRAAVIVGDPKQLPPTTFFERVDDGESIEEDEIEELESILDECIAAQIPQLTLDWHYRSQHEHLIAFSNYQYYENRLILFPAAIRAGMGVTLHPVPDGCYDRGRSSTNRAEAHAIVADVVRRLSAPETRHLSIGVVTFSIAQSTLIENLLDQARQEHAELEVCFVGSDRVPEPVFVKNLESVQGDERDVILFSVCYGPDADGKVTMNFGPLNRQGGERRLNVAMTRARREVHIYSTLTYDQIDLARTQAAGVADLRLYLQYAERGPVVLGGETRPGSLGDHSSALQRQVAARLAELGWESHPQVGCAGYRLDLAVLDPNRPGRYLAGIECDGAMYHAAPIARDRDKLRDGVMARLGWRLLRVWSTDWWRDPQKELQRLHAALCAWRDAPPPPPRAGANDPSLAPPPEPPAQDAAPPSPADAAAPSVASAVADGAPASSDALVATPPAGPTLPVYEPLLLDSRPSIDSDDIPHRAGRLQADMQAIVDREWPVSQNLLLRRVADAWGLRLTTKVRSHLAQVLARLERGGYPAQDSGDTPFYLPPGQVLAGYTAFRVADPTRESTRRDIEDVSLEEFGNAAQYVLHQQGSMSAKALAKEMATIMGYSRLTAKTEARVMAAIAHLQSRGDIG